MGSLDVGLLPSVFQNAFPLPSTGTVHSIPVPATVKTTAPVPPELVTLASYWQLVSSSNDAEQAPGLVSATDVSVWFEVTVVGLADTPTDGANVEAAGGL